MNSAASRIGRVFAVIGVLALPLLACSVAAARIDQHVVRGLDRVCADAPRGGESAAGADGSLWAVCRTAAGRPVVVRVAARTGAIRPIPLAGVDARARLWFRARDLTWASDGALWFHDGGGEVVRISPGLKARAFRLASTARTRGLIAGRGGDVWLTASATAGAQAERAIVRLAAAGTARRVAIARGSGAILPTAVLGADGDSVWFREGVAQLGRVTADGRHATWPVPVAGRPVAAEPDGGVDWLTFQPDEQLLRIGAGGDVLSRAAVVPRPVPRPAPPAPGHGLAWSLCLPPLSQLCQLDPERATINTLQVAQAGAYLTETPVSGPGGALWTEDSKGHLLRVGADGQTRSYPLHPRHGNAIELLAASGKALWMLEVNQHNRPRALTRVTT